jgi:phospholipase/carboxylesterase
MNRVAHWPTSQTTTAEVSEPFDLSTPFDPHEPAKAVFVPLRYEASHAYPLLVWLHDEGESESAMRRVVPRASLRNFVAVGVRGTSAIGESKAFTWKQTVEGIQTATANVMGCIRAMKARYHIKPSHVFIAGSGAGGTMALRIAHNFAGHFAGCASLGGPFPSSLRPLQAINRSRGMEVMIAHADAFAGYPAQRFCADMRLLFYAGSRILVREYETAEDFYKPMLRDLNRWLMGIVTGECLFDPEEIVLDLDHGG